MYEKLCLKTMMEAHLLGDLRLGGRVMFVGFSCNQWRALEK
jgi:hypothetical protein